MTPQKTWVGIDVCKAFLDVQVLPQGLTLQMPNSTSGIEQLIEQLQPLAPISIVLEATGGLERQVMERLQSANLPISRVNPRQVRGLATGLGKAKTDALDAIVLATFAQLVKPRVQPHVDVHAQQLSDLVRRRQQLVAMQVAEKNRLSSAPTTVQVDIREHLQQIQQRIESLNGQIQTLAQTQQDWQRKNTILNSVKGIGKVTSNLCLAELPELGKLSEKQIARLVGVAPLNHDSGKHKGKRRIAGGRTSVRCGLYMATLVATRHNPVIRAFYQKLLERGKLKKVALIACMRKLLIILNALIRDNKTWQAPA